LSILTKIFIVVLSVLVLIAAPVFISMAVTPYNWKVAYENQKKRADVADANAANQTAAAQVWKEYYQSVSNSFNDARSAFQTTLAGKDKDLAARESEAKAASNQVNTLSASVKAMQDQLTVQSGLAETVRTKLGEAEKANNALTVQVNQYQTLSSSQLAEIERLTRTVTELKIQAAQYQQEVAELRSKIEAAGAKSDAAPASATPIQATVTAVQDGLAQVNVGSADGVKKGMQFTVYRGGDFVAHLRISEVNSNSSAGNLIDITRTVKQGDKAATKLE